MCIIGVLCYKLGYVSDAWHRIHRLSVYTSILCFGSFSIDTDRTTQSLILIRTHFLNDFFLYCSYNVIKLYGSRLTVPFVLMCVIPCSVSRNANDAN